MALGPQLWPQLRPSMWSKPRTPLCKAQAPSGSTCWVGTERPSTGTSFKVTGWSPPSKIYLKSWLHLNLTVPAPREDYP